MNLQGAREKSWGRKGEREKEGQTLGVAHVGGKSFRGGGLLPRVDNGLTAAICRRK